MAPMMMPYTCTFLILNTAHMAIRLVWDLGFEPYPFSMTGEFWSGIAALIITIPLGLIMDGVVAFRRKAAACVVVDAWYPETWCPGK